ncbi:hypothetical protein ACOSQ3_002945 [Xanthoceras sorbifolium]
MNNNCFPKIKIIKQPTPIEKGKDSKLKLEGHKDKPGETNMQQPNKQLYMIFLLSQGTLLLILNSIQDFPTLVEVNPSFHATPMLPKGKYSWDKKRNTYKMNIKIRKLRGCRNHTKDMIELMTGIIIKKQ